MIQPEYLKRGDKVAIVAPAKRLQSGIEKAVKMLESWGLNVQLGEHLYNESNLFAGTDEERRTDLQKALDDPEIKAMIMARGGYGTTRILDQLDFTAFQGAPKWVCGFSDVTVLLQRLNNLGYGSIHSTVPVMMGKDEYLESDESLRKALFGESLSYHFGPEAQNREGQVDGQICGGNLSMICNSIGTPSEIDTNNGILIIEEVGEYLYHLDRMLVQLKRAGKFNHLNGLIVGHFTGMKDHSDTFGLDCMNIIIDQLREFDFPIAFGFPSGHEAPNMAFYMGLNAELTVKQNSASLNYKTGKQTG